MRKINYALFSLERVWDNIVETRSRWFYCGLSKNSSLKYVSFKKFLAAFPQLIIYDSYEQHKSVKTL